MTTPSHATRGRSRDADATKARILEAAKIEFATNGLGGARVDAISERANANKRMIYHYFGSKEDLFKVTIENAYLDIRVAEQKLSLHSYEPEEALERLIRFTWEYYLANPEFITLVNSENLHEARHLKKSESVAMANQGLIDLVKDILERGVKKGVFRADIDPIQLNITIAAIGYYYLTNRHTGSIIYGRDLMQNTALDDRLKFNIETILRLVCVS